MFENENIELHESFLVLCDLELFGALTAGDLSVDNGVFSIDNWGWVVVETWKLAPRRGLIECTWLRTTN